MATVGIDPTVKVATPAAAQPVLTPTVVAKPEPIEKADPMVDVLARWRDRLVTFSEQIASGQLEESTHIIEEAQQQVNGFIDDLANPGAITEDADWLISEFEKADDLLVLLQFEEADLVLPDAMRVLWQLSDCLSWAGRRNAQYHSAA